MFKYKLEVFPGKTNDNYLSSSINNDFNSILHQEGIIYNNSYVLINKNNKTIIRNFLSSNDEKGVIYLKKVYDRLYNGDISYSKDFDRKILEKDLNKVFYVKLNNLFYFQVKKPGINELETNNNYNSSARIFKQFFEESSYILNGGDSIKIDFEYKRTNYSKLGKNISFGFKMLFQNQMENEELFNTFSDKINFVEAYIKISTNSLKFEEIKKIAKKNFEVYTSKYNSYKLSDSKGSVLKLKNKFQIDSLISHSLIIPISNENSLNNKSKIVPYGIDITNNNLLKKQNINYEVILGKVFKNNIIENRDLLILKDHLLKNQHSVVIGQSGSGKSYSLASIIAGKVIKAIKNFNYNNKYGEKIIVIDPHSSFGNNILNIISEYEKVNKVNNFSKIVYSKNKDDGFVYKKLVFNPLFIPGLRDYLNDESKFLDELNYHSNSILTAIKGYFNETDFGPRNQNLLKKIINMLIVFNLIKYEEYLRLKAKTDLSEKEKDELLSNSMPYSIGDIVDILNEILQGNIRNDVYDSLKKLINSKYPILNQLGVKCDKYLNYLLDIVKREKSYIDSTINKLDVFASSLYKTFGGCSLINYTLDLQNLYLVNPKQVEFINFDLGDYSSDEKSIISNFLMAYSYNFGTRRNLYDKRLGEISIYIDEVNSILASQNAIEVLKKLYFEIRKYSISINSFFQNSKQKGFEDLYSNSGFVITFSNSKDEIEYILGDFNSGSISEINPNDIINLNRGSFYILLKTINKNITLSCDGLDFKKGEDLRHIIY